MLKSYFSRVKNAAVKWCDDRGWFLHFMQRGGVRLARIDNRYTSSKSLENEAPRKQRVHEVYFSLSFFKKPVGPGFEIGLSADYEETFTFDLEIPYVMRVFFSLNMTDAVWAKRFASTHQREAIYGIRAYLSYLKFSWGVDPTGWTDAGWSYYVELEKIFLGKYEWVTRHEQTFAPIAFTQPSVGGYPVTTHKAELSYKEVTKTFERFWIPNQTTKLVTIRVIDPPKFPGKGENSWDQGDDGTIEMSFYDIPCVDRETAIVRYQTHVTKMRESRT